MNGFLKKLLLCTSIMTIVGGSNLFAAQAPREVGRERIPYTVMGRDVHEGLVGGLYVFHRKPPTELGKSPRRFSGRSSRPPASRALASGVPQNRLCKAVDTLRAKGILYADFFRCPDVEELPNNAFSGCPLVCFGAPCNLTTIGGGAFGNCGGLRSFFLPDSVVELGEGVFLGCKRLNHCILSSMIRRIPDCFFSGCWRLSLIRIPSRVESIGKSAFERCSQLTSISLPDACAQIGDSAFASSGLTQIYLSNGEVTIHPEAFNDILGETFEFLPRSSGQVLNLQYIPDRGFANSRSLEAVTVPQSVVSIGNMAFFGCRSLQSICLCNVLQLRDGVFVDCGLRSINVSRVRNFGKRIFKGCPRLMDITLPRGLSVDNIPDQDNVSTDRFPEFTVSPDTFYGVLQDCKAIVGVRKVQLLDLLSELCTELREYKPDVSYQNAWISGVTDSSFTGTIEPNVFSENSVLKYAYFERASGIGKVAFGSCLSLRAVKMPAVKHVWQSAFWACPGLDTVIISHDATYHSDKDASMQLCACAPTSPSTEKSPKYNQFIFSQNVTKYVILAPFASPEECSQIKVIADTRIGELFPAWGGPEKQLIVTDRID